MTQPACSAIMAARTTVSCALNARQSARALLSERPSMMIAGHASHRRPQSIAQRPAPMASAYRSSSSSAAAAATNDHYDDQEGQTHSPTTSESRPANSETQPHDNLNSSKFHHESLASAELPIAVLEQRARAVGASAALAAFPTLARHMHRKDISDALKMAAALNEIKTQTPASVSIQSYLLVLMSPRSTAPLTEDQVWKAYTGLVVASAERFEIESRHIDSAISSLLRLCVRHIAPSVSDLIGTSPMQAFTPILESLQSKLEQLAQDAEMLGFAPSKAVWSARIAVAVAQNQYKMMDKLYFDAHTKPDNDVHSAPGLTTEGYAIVTIMHARQFKSAEWTNIKFSIDNLKLPQDLDTAIAATSRVELDEELMLLREFENKIEKEKEPPLPTNVQPGHAESARLPKTPTSKSTAWNIFSHLKHINPAEAIIAYEMLLYIFGRLREIRGVRKLISTIMMSKVKLYPKTFYIAVDAASESSVHKMYLDKLIRKFWDLTQDLQDRLILNGRLKHAIAVDDARAGWELLPMYTGEPKRSKLLAGHRPKCIGFDDASARMFAFVALLDHPFDPILTKIWFTVPLAQQLVSGDTALCPDTWVYIIRAFSKYRSDAAQQHVVDAYHTLVNDLIPSWQKHGHYGMSDANTPWILDTAAAHDVAYAFGRTLDDNNAIRFFTTYASQPSSAPSSESNRNRQEFVSIVKSFVTGWIDAQGDRDALHQHLSLLRQLLPA